PRVRTLVPAGSPGPRLVSRPTRIHSVPAVRVLPLLVSSPRRVSPLVQVRTARPPPHLHVAATLLGRSSRAPLQTVVTSLASPRYREPTYGRSARKGARLGR